MGCVPKLPVGVPKPFEISCYDSPASFEVALKEHSEASDALEQLLESADQFEPLQQDVDIGDMCVGKFSEDGLWYRAEVIGIRAARAEAGTESPPLLKLKFIDYGNQEEMPLTPSRVRCLPTPLAEIKPFIFHCCLDNVSPVGASATAKWPKECEEILFNVAEGSMVRCFSVNRTANGVVHRVQIGPVDAPNLAATKLVEKGFAKLSE